MMYIRQKNETVMVLVSHAKTGHKRSSESRHTCLSIHKFKTGIQNNIMVKLAVKHYRVCLFCLGRLQSQKC